MNKKLEDCQKGDIFTFEGKTYLVFDNQPYKNIPVVDLTDLNSIARGKTFLDGESLVQISNLPSGIGLLLLFFYRDMEDIETRVDHLEDFLDQS